MGVTGNTVRGAYQLPGIWADSACVNCDVADSNTVTDANGNLVDLRERVAVTVSTTNVPSLVGPRTINGYTTVGGETVLLVGQTDPTQNGPWVIPPVTTDVRLKTLGGAWTRPLWFPRGMVIHRATVVVLAGNGAGTTYSMTSASGVKVGTDAQTWADATPLSGATRNQPNGFLGLDSTGKASVDQLPDVATVAPAGLFVLGDSIAKIGYDTTTPTAWGEVGVDLGLAGYVNVGQSGTSTTEAAVRMGALDLAMTSTASQIDAAINSQVAVTVTTTPAAWQDVPYRHRDPHRRRRHPDRRNSRSRRGHPQWCTDAGELDVHPCRRRERVPADQPADLPLRRQ